MSSDLQKARSIVATRRDQHREELLELLRIPSVSSDSSRGDAMRQAADLVRTHVDAAGLSSEIIPTGGFPVVYGERAGRRDGPSVLIYGHYDVQPASRGDGWDSEPFEPVLRDGDVIARGSTDDKGQCFALICGIRAALEAGIGKDVTIKVLIEGEEEVGSPSLVPFIRKEGERLRADVVVISDSSQLGPGLPAITYGLRGIICMELILRGPKQDLHSGSFGGAVANPANVLARILNACQEPFGKIAIPGFYDRVRELDQEEREAFRSLPFDEEGFREEVGAPKLWGEDGFSSLERKWARPTFDVNGLISGHSGEGVKTVLPAEARGKFSMRLVPDQDPDEICAITRDFVLSLVPDCVSAEILTEHGARPVVVDRNTEHFRCAERAIEYGFGKKPYLIREGGSIPVVNTFKDELGMDSLLIGLGLPDDGAHGPNEKFSLQDFEKGMLTMAALLGEIEKR